MTEEMTDLVTASRLHGDQPEGTYALAMLSDDEFEARLDLLKKGRERMALAQREYMVEDEDYGTIPGTPKPTLFKPGAEKLLQLYGLVARIETEFVAGDNVTTPPLTFNADAYIHRGSFDGPVVGVGQGTANSWEKRYRRDSDKVCPACGKAAIIKSKPEFGGGFYCFPKKGGCGTRFKEDDPSILEQATGGTGDAVTQWDLGVTLLKMAEKRALVGVTLRVTATSGLFTQDLAEEPPERERGMQASSTREERPVEVRVTRDVVPDPPMEVEEFIEKVLDATGGEEVGDGLPLMSEYADDKEYSPPADVVEVTPSAVKGVGRGGRTGRANSAQIGSVKAYSKSLKLGPHGVIDEYNALFAANLSLPADLKEASDALLVILDAMSDVQIGKLIQRFEEMKGEA